MQRRHFLLGAAAALCGPVLAAEDQTWIDRARGRLLPVRMRWPQGDAPCALVILSHGLGGSRDGGDVWGQAWQRAGVAVLHVQHAGSDSEVFRGGMRALRAAASAEQLRARVADVQFAVDEITRRRRQVAPDWQRVPLDAIGAAGHSFGATTVQALAGQRFPVATRGIAEPRLKAFIALSPALGQDRVEGALAAVTRPFLAITGSLDSDALGRGLTGADRARVYDALPSGQRALLWLDGADHMSFAGNGEQRLRARAGPLKRDGIAVEREAVHHQRVAAITTLWWRAHLAGDGAARAALRAPPGLAAEDRWRMD